VSDNPYVPQNSDTSHHDDLRAVQTTAFGRRRMVTALLHGHSRSETDRPRRWPFAVTGLLATGLVAAGFGVADAYQDQRDADRKEVSVLPIVVDAPEPTATPTPTAPSSQPTQPETQQPTTKQPTQTEKPDTTKQTQPKSTTKSKQQKDKSSKDSKQRSEQKKDPKKR
jgi:outer membrane biosynthesis protein TonB